MSYTSLWTIDRNWSGKEYMAYPNSWLFPPVVWDALLEKYIPKYERQTGYGGEEVKSYMAWTQFCFGEERNRRLRLLNDRVNNCGIQYDRVLWELANLSVFNAKDKEFVADCIVKFTKENIDSSPEYENASQIRERFLEIADDIRSLPKRVKFFVIHPTSCDDNVERWFNRHRLRSWDKRVCEFTIIEDGEVAGFSDNIEMCKAGGGWRWVKSRTAIPAFTGKTSSLHVIGLWNRTI